MTNKRDKNGRFVKGYVPIKPFSGKEMLGKKHTDETRQKIRNAHKGKKLSEEHKKKLRKAKIGYVPWIKGRNHSEATKKRISLAQKGKPKYGLRGKNNYLWKGGITPLTKQIRQCLKYRQWRSDVFTRDDYTCQFCGMKGIYIQADHYPKMFSEIFAEYSIKSLEEALNCEEFWNINNGRTLCKECHYKYGKYRS